MYHHAFTYVHALTSSVSAASAPSDRSFATVLAIPWLLAMCNAVCRVSVCQRRTHSHTSVPCNPPITNPPPLPLPSLPLRSALPPSLSLRHAAPDTLCSHPSHHTRSQPRLVPYLRVEGAGELGRLHKLRRRLLVPVAACLHQGRAAHLYVCVQMRDSMHAMRVEGRRTAKVERE